MKRKCGRCAGPVDKEHYFCEDCREAFDRINHTPIKKKPRKNSRSKFLYGCFIM